MTQGNSLKVYLALVFLSGILVGGIGVWLFTSKTAASGFNPQDARRRYSEEMQTRLRLTPEQSTRLQEIFKSTHQRLVELRGKWQPEVKAIQDEQVEQIRQMLNEEQRAEYEKMRQEREEFRRRGGQRPPGSPGRRQF